MVRGEKERLSLGSPFQSENDHLITIRRKLQNEWGTVIRAAPRDDRPEIQPLHHRALSQEAVWKADNLIVLSTQFIINIFIKLITENTCPALARKQW